MPKKQKRFMKKLFFVMCIICLPSFTWAQIITESEVATFGEKYGFTQMKGAFGSGKGAMVKADSLLNSGIWLPDDKNQLTVQKVIDLPNKSKEEIFTLLMSWFNASFNDGKSVVQHKDKENGVIIAKGIIPNVAAKEDWMLGSYNRFSLQLLIKIDIRENKIRVTIATNAYLDDWYTSASKYSPARSGCRERIITECYPFVQKGITKKAEAETYVMSYLYSNMLLDKIENSCNIGIFGNENDNW